MADKSGKAKKQRTINVETPSNLNTANHLTYLFQVDALAVRRQIDPLVRLDGSCSAVKNGRSQSSSTFDQTDSTRNAEKTNSTVSETIEYHRQATIRL
jgi:hypothetical protein